MFTDWAVGNLMDLRFNAVPYLTDDPYGHINFTGHICPVHRMIQGSGDTAPLVLHAALLSKQEPRIPIAHEVGWAPNDLETRFLALTGGQNHHT